MCSQMLNAALHKPTTKHRDKHTPQGHGHPRELLGGSNQENKPTAMGGKP